MLTIPPNSVPFVNHVVYFFDGLRYPGKEMKEIENYNAEEVLLVNNITRQPAVLQTEIYNNAVNISHWIALTGLLNATPKDATTQRAIRDSALHRLRQLGVQHARFRNPTEELMEYVFVTAYTHASSQGKEEMIRQIAPLNTNFESTATRGKRLALKVTLLVSKLLQSRIGKVLAFAAVHLLVTFVISFIFLGFIICLIKAYLFILTHSPLVAKVFSVLIKGSVIFLAGQPIILVISRIGIRLTRRLPALQHRVVHISNIFLLPLHTYVRFINFMIRPALAAPDASDRMGRSLGNIQNRQTAAFYLEQGIKGRAVWLHLTTR
jgi:hypothetical protein